MDTWVLQQITDRQQLEQLGPQLQRITADTDVVGISLRFPWQLLDRDWQLLDDARTLAPRFSVRFMAGVHTPARMLGGASYVDESGGKVPCPFLPSGALNVGFLEHWSNMVNDLCVWAASSDVGLVHLSWFAEDWAELNHGALVRRQPGYSPDAWREAHEYMVARAVEAAAEHDVDVELPLSGYGPLGDLAYGLGRFAAGLSGHGRLVVQANGWSEEREFGQARLDVEEQFRRIWGLPLRRGLQAIQPQPMAWEPMFARAAELEAEYVEVYRQSFTGAGSDTLAAQVAAYRTPDPEPEPEPDPEPVDVPVGRAELAAHLRALADALEG